MRKMIPLLLAAGLAASGTTLGCDAPTDSPQIPDGKSATREAMVAAQKAVLALDTAVKAYSACLQDKQQHDPTTAGNESKLVNDEISRLQKIAERFNRELRAFKAQNAS